MTAPHSDLTYESNQDAHPTPPAFPIEGVELDLPRYKTAQMDRRLHVSGAQWELVESFSAYEQAVIDSERIILSLERIGRSIASVDRDEAPEEVLETVRAQEEQVAELRGRLNEIAKAVQPIRYRFGLAVREAARQLVGPKVFDNELMPLVGEKISIDLLDEWCYQIVQYYQGGDTSAPAKPGDADPFVTSPRSSD